MSRLLVILVAAGLSACGMKGSLMLPPGPPPEPVLGNPKPATPAGTPKDVSTPAKTTTQQ